MITHIQQESRACLTEQQRARLDTLLLEIDTKKLNYWLGDPEPDLDTTDGSEGSASGRVDDNPSLETTLFETAGVSKDITEELEVLMSYSELVLDDDFMQTYRTLLKFADKAHAEELTNIAISTLDEIKSFLIGALVDSQVEVISAFDFYRNCCERLLKLPKSDRKAVILPDLSSEAMKERVRLNEDLDRLVQNAKVKGFDERTLSDAFRKLEALIAYGSDDDYKEAAKTAGTFQKVLMRHTMKPQTDIYSLIGIGDSRDADFPYVMEKVSEIQLLELGERLSRLLPRNKLVRRTFERAFGEDIVECAKQLSNAEQKFCSSDIFDSDTACTSLLSYAEVNLDLTYHFTGRLLSTVRGEEPPELDERYIAKHRYMSAVSRDLEMLEDPTGCDIETVNSAFNLSSADMHDRHINDLIRQCLEQSGMRGSVYVMVTEYFYCGLDPKICDPLPDTDERLRIGQSKIVVDVFNAENAPRELKLISKEPNHEKKETLLESMTMAYAIPDRRSATEHLPRLSGFQLSEESKCFFLAGRYDTQARFLWRAQDNRSAKLVAYRPTYQTDSHAAAVGFAVTSPHIELVSRYELAEKIHSLTRREC